MSYSDNPYASTSMFDVAARADVGERADFIAKTYAHLLGAIAAFVGIEALLFQTAVPETMLQVLGQGRFAWLVVVGAFMVVSWVANSWALSATSIGKQYAGLGLYVVAQALIFTPLLALALMMENGTSIIGLSAVITLGLFAVMSAIVFVTRKDFSFLRSLLIFGGFAALGFIVLGAFVPAMAGMGPLFVYGMIALACGYILYDTSNVLHHYRIGQHVAAALALFSSVALLFWYVLQAVMSSRD